MTQDQIQVLDNYYDGKVTTDIVLQEFGENIEDEAFIRRVLQDSITSKDRRCIRRAMSLLRLHGNYEKFVDEFNILLLEPNHRNHQEITKTLQDLKNPKSIPFIEKVLKSNFDYLEYTGSESDVIAKWFSWALYSIGTKEAIDLIKEYTKSENEGIRNEMIYRLNKVKK